MPVSATTGVGGFVFPGDRVDMMLTQSVEGNDEGPALSTTETILRNLRILATDQSTETTTTPDGKTEVRAVRTVTLEVTPWIAEKIQVAATIGTLSLALRSIADNQTELERAIASGAVDLPDRLVGDPLLVFDRLGQPGHEAVVRLDQLDVAGAAEALTPALFVLAPTLAGAEIVLRKVRNRSQTAAVPTN